MSTSDRPKLQTALQLLKRFFLFAPVCWVVVVVSLIIEENYPFSDFPMYSKIQDYSWYLHVTDEKGNILFFREEFGDTAVKLKKVYKNKRDKLMKENDGMKIEEARATAGLDTLSQYHRTRKPRKDNPTRYQKLDLWKETVSRVNGKLHFEKELLASYEPEKN